MPKVGSRTRIIENLHLKYPSLTGMLLKSKEHASRIFALDHAAVELSLSSKNTNLSSPTLHFLKRRCIVSSRRSEIYRVGQWCNRF